ncbi:glycosyltransferase family 1 protein [Pholiota conissans]|uniref:sterol 3beta-glucosyltransferase n=1 Tax=Pholiota conissans TaxID=109636 RepID=A0A9P6CWZ7_9AGAR|nr:glycosyltransferase family 1 protein [Pholiota conissans]
MTSKFFTRLLLRSKSKSSKSNDANEQYESVAAIEVTVPGNTSAPENPRQSQTFPLISQLQDSASEFEKVLLGSGCINPEGVCPKGGTGFVHLVGSDLSPCERSIIHRVAKICAANKLTDIPSPEESASEDLQLESDEDGSEELLLCNLQSDVSLSAVPSIHRASIDDEESERLKPEEIVDLLIEEFGPMAGSRDKEKLLLETDGCILRHVAIVGVIHLTTHRLTFHASLLATNQDLSEHEVVKAGAAVLHRKGWRGKRRIWLELSNDMLCMYASSKEEDKSRPLCSLLLAFVQDIYPRDPNNPRLMKLLVDPRAQSYNDYAEFDTEESAQDWRKELTGALFRYRHLRREMYTSTSSESTGVRICIPLTSITKLDRIPSLDFSSIVALTVKLSVADFPFENEVIPDSQVFEIGPITSVDSWESLGDIIAKSKVRHFRIGRLSRDLQVASPVIIDFGPYNFFPNAEVRQNSPTELKKKNKDTVRNALGFDVDTELWIARAHIYRTVMSSGYFAISKDHLGFWSKSVTQQDIRYRLPLSTIQSIKPFALTLLNVEGIKLRIQGKRSVKFVFKSISMRNEALAIIAAAVQGRPADIIPRSQSPLEISSLTTIPADTISTSTSPTKLDAVNVLAPLSRAIASTKSECGKLPQHARYSMPKVINLPPEFLPKRKSLHFICLTIGSRGDVQPYIALGLGLRKEGHRVTIVTHEEYKEWICGFGLDHRSAGGDPGLLMKLSVENKMFSPDFFRESLANVILLDAWIACYDADVLLESPSAMAGIHIAEALDIPYFRTFTMPWTKTTAFPHAFLSPPVDSPTFNSASNVMWAATSNQINKWRRQCLRLENTDIDRMAESKITFIYNFSEAVVPKPLDWPDTTTISGYWFLDNPEHGWDPPPELLTFMEKARTDKKPLVYIGFGSITVPRPNKVTAAIVKAVIASDIRAIITKGWSARMQNSVDKELPVIIPPECFMLDKVPHDWLFPRIDAALHHGGAGTTGASLRAGIPTLIKPWFGDQFFWASRVQALGAGLKINSLSVRDLTEGLIKATRTQSIKDRATAVGVKIRMENGVHKAIRTIYMYFDRASKNRTALDKK